MDRRFKERAVELMRAIGVHGVSVENLMVKPAFRAQFRAMLMDAKLRFDPTTENYASICRLIDECDSHKEPPPIHEDLTSMQLGARGRGYQVPRLEEPEPRPLRELLPEEYRDIDDRR